VLVTELNADMQKSGNALTEVMRQQIEAQTTLENIDEAIDTLKASPVLDLNCSFLRNACACWGWRTEYMNSLKEGRAMRP